MWGRWMRGHRAVALGPGDEAGAEAISSGGAWRAIREGMGRRRLADVSHSVNDPARRHLVWAVKLALFSGAAAWVGFFALLAVWLVTPPKVVHVPVFVRVGSPEDRVLFFEPGEVTVDTKFLVTQDLLAQYVVWRETIDFQTEGDRYEKMNALSAAAEMREFLGKVSTENPESPLVKFREAGMRRTIEVGVIAPVSANTWRIELVTVDTYGTPGPGTSRDTGVRRKWVAVVTVSEEPTASHRAGAMVNPWGLRVTRYTLSAAS